MKTWFKYFLVVSFVVGFCVEGLAQSITWQKFYRTKGIPDVTVITDIVQTDDEGYIFIGRSARDSAPGQVMFAYGIDKYGDSLWYKEYRYFDPGGKIKKLNDGNFMIVDGFCSLVKIKSNGDTLWTRVRPDSLHILYRFNFEYENNEFFICGRNSYTNKPYILRLDSLGNEILYREFDYSFGSAITLLVNDNNILISGTVISSYNYFLYKIDLSGNTIWYKDYLSEPLNFHGSSIIKNPYEESYILGGFSGTGSGTKAALLKRDSSGSIDWHNIYKIRSGINEIMKDLTNNIISIDDEHNSTGNTAWLIKFDFDGNETWRKNYSLTQEHFSPWCLEVTIDSGYIFGGLALGGAHQNTPIYIIKTDKIGNVVSVNNSSQLLPKGVKLNQNFPNPFNPSTIISYEIPKRAHVKLSIYDILGKEVKVLINEKKNAGKYEVKWNAGDFSSGIYFYTLDVENFIITKKLIYLK
jgi:hypothetical protein